MAGTVIGFGVGIKYHTNITKKVTFNPPHHLSCFSTGIWEMEGLWLSDDKWSMNPMNLPFLSSGIWNDEGIFRFKDNFNFGFSFLPTGNFLYDGIYRYSDQIKIKSDENFIYKNKKIDKTYWNF